jgi:hypothetical protein
MLRASQLDAEVFEEVEADRGATLQAAGVVVLASAAAGIGTFGNHGAAGIFWYTVAALAGWYVWALVACEIGTRLLPGPHTVSDHGELLRTIGFSSAPGILRIFAVIPAIAGLVFVVSTLWMLVAMVVAVRQALDYESTWRAIGVCALGFPVYALTLVLTLLLMGPWPI